MARTASVLSGGVRLTDYLGVGVIANVFPLDDVRTALKETGRESQRIRLITAEVMVYYVICLGLFRTVSKGEGLRCLAEGLRSAGLALPTISIAKKASISAARIRLGVAPADRGLHRDAADRRRLVSRPPPGRAGRRLVCAAG